MPNDYFRIETGGTTNTGCVRDHNEDSFVVRPDQGIWVVADGMGGHAAGDYASQSIITCLSNMRFADQPLNDVVQSLDDQLNEVNQEMINYARAQDASAVGSTVAIMHLGNYGVGVSYWVGDSRIYRYRDQQLEQLSRDHSFVQELVDLGEITEEAAVNYPSKNVITRAIGANRQVYSDITLFDYQVGDVYLICSDGLNNELNDEELAHIIQRYHSDMEKLAVVTLKAVLTKAAADNVSFVFVQILP